MSILRREVVARHVRRFRPPVAAQLRNRNQMFAFVAGLLLGLLLALWWRAGQFAQADRHEANPEEVTEVNRQVAGK